MGERQLLVLDAADSPQRLWSVLVGWAGRLASVYSYPSAVSLPGCSSLVESLSVEFDKNKLFQFELVTNIPTSESNKSDKSAC